MFNLVVVVTVKTQAVLRFGTVTRIVDHKVGIALGSLMAFEFLGVPTDNLSNTPACARPAVEDKAIHQSISGGIMPANVKVGIR